MKKGRLYLIKDDLAGLDRRWPAFLRADVYEMHFELERLLEKHATFDRLYPEKR